MSTALCIDVGGTKLRAGLLGTGEQAPTQLLGSWPVPQDISGFEALLSRLLKENPVSCVGMGMPGIVSQSRCLWVPNIPYLDGVDIGAMLHGEQLSLGNDAHLALLAEAAYGAAADDDNAILIAIGTGIGSAILSDGKIVKGQGGSATSLGWACADLADAGDSSHGWLERQASGTALDELARRNGLRDGASLLDAARKGSRSATESLERPAKALGAALATALALVGATKVIASGGVAESLDVMEPLIRRQMERHLPPHLRQVAIGKGRFGQYATLMGAGIAALGHPAWTGS